MTERGHFGTRIGVILATAGSAVGLGNIWRFPYMTGQNGGAAFILIYIGCVLLLGIPGMVAEFIVGRHSGANAARAYKRLAGGRPWQIVGYLGVFTSMIIFGFYSVVAGWCLQYLYVSLTGQLHGNAEFVRTYFETFSTGALMPVFWTVVFILLTHMVVVRGIRGGIERASNLFMPTLFVLLAVIVVAACTLPGAGRGVEFLFRPDFSKVDNSVLLEALGQAFFSLSLGTACLCTYASYFSRQTRLLASAGQIAAIDTLIAVLAGLMIFPAAFSVGVNPDSGPSLIFITLPNVFQQAFASVPGASYVVSVLFYALLALAALTSTISMHEIGTAFFTEELRLTRSRGAWIETCACIVIGVVCALSMGAVGGLQLFGRSVMDFCDFLTAQILLPAGSFATCLFVGWYVPQHIVRDEFTNGTAVSTGLYRVWLFLVRFVSPSCIVIVFLHQLGLI
ncbi:MAG: sodium-dependent transporter [Prevotella sp.]|nr:sodium-dependent transporter [Prevotella sp.]